MGSPSNSDGASLCGFELVHRVAQSYLGPLWLAADQRGGAASGERLTLLRRVELPGNAPPEVRQAIARAASDARRLDHVNILSVHDVLEDGAELAVAYEHVEAEPLRSLQASATLRRLSFPIAVSLRIAIDLLMGLRSLHQMQVSAAALPAFGGLTPDSVLVSRSGDTKLCDVLVAGCASLLEGIGSNTGKLAYAAPEQVNPIVPLTAQCDVFAVGVMLWELLTSRRLLSGSRALIERKLLEHDLPSLLDVRGGEAVCPALAGVIDAALAADPRHRPSSALAMAEQLRQCGHFVASREEVAEFVVKISGQRFERRTSSLQMKLVAQPEAPASEPEPFEKTWIGTAPPANQLWSPAALRAPGLAMKNKDGAERRAASPAPAVVRCDAAVKGSASSGALPAPPADARDPSVVIVASERPAALAAAIAAAAIAAPPVVAPPRAVRSKRLPLPARRGPRPHLDAAASPAPEAAPPVPIVAELETAPPVPVTAEPEAAPPVAAAAEPELTKLALRVPAPARATSEPTVAKAAPPPPQLRTQPTQPAFMSARKNALAAAESATKASRAAHDRTMIGVGAPGVLAPAPGPPQTAAAVGLEAPAAAAGPSLPSASLAPRVSLPPEPALCSPVADTPVPPTLSSLDPRPDVQDPAPSSDRHAFSFPPAPIAASSWRARVALRRPGRRAPWLNAVMQHRVVLSGAALVLVVAFAIGAALKRPVLEGDGAAPVAAAILRGDEPAVEAPPAELPEPAVANLPAPSVPAREQEPDVEAPAVAAEPDAEASVSAAPAARDFSVAKLDDSQLVEWFGLEQRRDLPACAERLGKGATYTGKRPAAARAKLKAARVSLQRGKLEQAYTDFCAATAHDPKNADAQRGLAELALALGDAKVAKEAAERGLARAPKNTDLRAILGDALALSGDLAGSRETWLGMLRMQGSEAQRRQRLATEYQKAGEKALRSSNPARARSYLRRALILTEGSYAPSLGFGEALLKLAQPRAGLAWAERAARALPKSARAQILLGDAYAKSGEPKQARAAWRAARRVEPKNKIAARRLSRGLR